MIQGSWIRKAIPLDEADIYILVSGIILCNIWPTYITAKAEELKAYCINNGYNADYGILVDYGMHSFQKRLFVYDFNKEKVILRVHAPLEPGERVQLREDFSIIPASHCSSLCHNRVGRSRNMYRSRCQPLRFMDWIKAIPMLCHLEF